MNRIEKRKMLRVVGKNLNNITSSAKDIAKEWGVSTIPLKTMRIIIDKSKPKTEDPKLSEFINQYNKTLETLYKEFERIAKVMNSKSIPLSEVEKGVNIILTNFIKGMNEPE